MTNTISDKKCRRCGSSNVTYKSCLNCGESYPYTDLFLSKGTVILGLIILVGGILFVAIGSSLRTSSESGSSLYSDFDSSIIFGAIILIIVILVRKGRSGKL